jgi:hypothetical protein
MAAQDLAVLKLGSDISFLFKRNMLTKMFVTGWTLG